jgi:hypothetical protein
MSTFREKAQGRTKQMIGQMMGDELLVTRRGIQTCLAALSMSSRNPP